MKFSPPDHPRIRASRTCPFCHKDKNPGLVVCWTCYKKEGLKYGNPEAEASLDKCEAALRAESKVSA